MIDFRKEVEKIKDELIADIKSLCSIPSIYDEGSIGTNQPFGKPCRDALDAMLSIGRRDGFIVEDVDGYAGHIDIGDGDDCFGILGHLDVVPVNAKGWDSDPFTVTTLNNKLYGRGVADDKGPLLAGYYAAKIIHDLGLPTKMKTRVIFGCSEELDSSCVKYYFTKKEFPAMGFTPDANFPVVYGEKAGVSITIKGLAEKNGLIGLCAGHRPNIVPENCEAVVEGNYKNYKESFETFINKNNLQGSIEEEGNHTKLILIGKSSHASMPELGINAVVSMVEYLNEVTQNTLVKFIHEYLSDYHGKGLGINHVGEMGALTMNLGVIAYRKNAYEITLDLRCPHDCDFEHLIANVRQACQKYNMSETHEIGKALYVDPKSELITKLHAAYVDTTNDHSTPQAIGGGTYAKSMPNCVAFGPEFPSEDNRIHENNECINIDSLLKATEIYARALYNVIQKD
jgi:predicted dipeptidase